MDIDSVGAGYNLRKLTHDTDPENYPSWSPDGKRLAYQRDFNGSAVYVINADGSGEQRLSPTPGFDVTPSWSPDGSKIVYVRLPGIPQPAVRPITDIRMINADGTSDHSVLANTPFSVEPRWSVNDRLVFMSAIILDGRLVEVPAATGFAKSEAALRAAPRLGRIRDPLHAQFFHPTPNLGQTVLIHLVSGLYRDKETAAPILYKEQNRPRCSITSRSAAITVRVSPRPGAHSRFHWQHRPAHDQVVPLVALQPAMLAPVDVQQHPWHRCGPRLRRSPPHTLPATLVASTYSLTRSCAHPAASRGNAAMFSRNTPADRAARLLLPSPSEPDACSASRAFDRRVLSTRTPGTVLESGALSGPLPRDLGCLHPSDRERVRSRKPSEQEADGVEVSGAGGTPKPRGLPTHGAIFAQRHCDTREAARNFLNWSPLSSKREGCCVEEFLNIESVEDSSVTGCIVELCGRSAVANDYTIQFDHKTYQIARADIRAGLRHAAVRVEVRLDGSIAVRFREHYLEVPYKVNVRREGEKLAPGAMDRGKRPPGQRRPALLHPGVLAGIPLHQLARPIPPRSPLVDLLDALLPGPP